MRNLLLLVPVLALAAIGCGEHDLGTKGGETPSTQADVKRIEDNPNMPPQAKAAAKAQMQAHTQPNGGH